MRWPVLRVPISCRSHRRWRMSVVFDRPISACFRPPGAMVLFALSWLLARVQLDLYRWTVFTAFYSGWLAAPLTHLLLGLWLVFSRDANPGWGDWCRSRGGWGFLLGFCFLVLSNCESATLLVMRLGLMPCSAWSKKKSCRSKRSQGKRMKES